VSGWRIVCAGLAGTLAAGRQDSPDGQYLASYDPEAHGGRGSATWTPDPAKAMTFGDARAAFESWQQVPRSRPVRPDGKPNHPLTAFTVAIVPDGEVPR
jgi:hypothetical protein